MGSAKGWTVFFGGHSGFNSREGVQAAAGLSSDEVRGLIRRLLTYYKCHAQPKERTSRFLERVGTAWLEAGKAD